MAIINNIFRAHGDAVVKKYKYPYHVLRVVEAIQKCRTIEMGFHIIQCEDCGYEITENNSCRNRNCPTCQSLNREKWIKKTKELVLPTGHLHIVVTVPEELNSLMLKNQEHLYKALFDANAETLLKLGEDRQHLGGKIGVISILHTWGQNLSYHPHIHSIVTAGGVRNNNEWVKIKSKGKFFVHVKVISKLFKGKFLSKLENLYYENKLIIPENLSELKTIHGFEEFVQNMRLKKFVSCCKEPFENTENAIEYLGRYSHRVAISNNRVVDYKEGIVTFKWKDYRDNQIKLMNLSGEEFIRRMLLHVLPSGFVKIRYYGLYSNRSGSLLEICREILTPDEENTQDLKEIVSRPLMECPCCKKTDLKVVVTVYRKIRAPPIKNSD